MHFTSVAHAARFKDITFVLLKYGFDEVVQRLDVPGKVLLEKVVRTKEGLTEEQRLRGVIEELGPTFIKFGQVLGLRSGLLPPELARELRKLQDEVAPVPFEKIRARVEKSLGQPLDAVFGEFQEEPAAAASLAQVHHAVLRETGEPVAVKVQRPGIRKVIEHDLAILEIIAGQLDQRMEVLAVYELPKLVEEFRKTLTRELDYHREARNMDIFRSNFADDPLVHIPELHRGYCTKDVLVMELVRGVKPTDLPEEPPEARRELAIRGLRMIVKQVLEDGFFHADPHPGNLRVLPDGTLCLLDCGMVGRVTDSMRFQLTSLLRAIVGRDSDRLVDGLLDLIGRYDGVQRDALERDVLDLLDSYHSTPLAQLEIGQFLTELVDTLRQHSLFLPPNLGMMIKALVTAEGVARDLDPELDVVAQVEPMVKRLATDELRPARLWRALRRTLWSAWHLQRSVPRRLHRLLEKAERGTLTIRFQHEKLEHLNETLEDVGSRLTVAIILAALIIGSSLIITTGVGPLLFGFPALGIVGYLFSGILGLWVVINIIRSDRR